MEINQLGSITISAEFIDEAVNLVLNNFHHQLINESIVIQSITSYVHITYATIQVF